MKEDTKTYLIEANELGGALNIKRVNHGFSAIELMGILELIKDDLIKQAKGEIKPGIIERRAIRDKTE